MTPFLTNFKIARAPTVSRKIAMALSFFGIGDYGLSATLAIR